MPIYYKIALEGSYLDKPIINIMYYVLQNTDSFAFDATQMADLGTQVAAVYVTNALPYLPLAYSFQRAVVTAHDPDGSTFGFQVEVSGSGNGGLAETSDGRDQAGIIAFRTLPWELSPSLRNLRSSYLSFGPLVSTLIGNNGAVAWPLGSDEELSEFCQRTYTLETTDVALPVRVGKRPIDVNATICTVEQVLFRPFKGKRSSRGQSPTGQ